MTERNTIQKVPGRLLHAVKNYLSLKKHPGHFQAISQMLTDLFKDSGCYFT